jgi:hypothetical protein
MKVLFALAPSLGLALTRAGCMLASGAYAGTGWLNSCELPFFPFITFIWFVLDLIECHSNCCSNKYTIFKHNLHPASSSTIKLFLDYFNYSNLPKPSVMENQKSVLITGCSEGGIGDALAQEFLKRGCKVFATARNLDTVQHLKELGCEVYKLDVTDEESVQSAVEFVEKRAGGKLGILVNNAGTGKFGRFLQSIQQRTPLATFDFY